MSRQIDLTFRWLHPRVDESWQERAACQNEDPDMFFPEFAKSVNGKRGSSRRLYNRQVRAAQLICMECPVIGKCLQYALAVDIRYGIWGGTTEIDRARLKGRRRAHE